MRYFKFCNAFQDIYQRVNIILIIHQRLLNRFAYCFESSKMYDAKNVPVFLEDGMCIIKIAKVYRVVFYFAAKDFFNSNEDCRIASAIVVYLNNVESILHKVYNGVRTDITTSAGNQNFFHDAKKTKKSLK